ncbi:hypothetical protein DFQ30_005911 [Apophysomyces sp. BC1015]|nr:hypothetical protein DFQ30_005911 [Apophysomyces sp. BC1015]KAG0177395.1 hypothetical protein DFQ29_004887 [Apophysomyces sp. BC1021]
MSFNAFLNKFITKSYPDISTCNYHDQESHGIQTDQLHHPDPIKIPTTTQHQTSPIPPYLNHYPLNTMSPLSVSDWSNSSPLDHRTGMYFNPIALWAHPCPHDPHTLAADLLSVSSTTFGSFSSVAESLVTEQDMLGVPMTHQDDFCISDLLSASSLSSSYCSTTSFMGSQDFVTPAETFMNLATPTGPSTITSPAVSTTSDFWLSPVIDHASPSSNSIEHLMEQYLVIASPSQQQQQQPSSPQQGIVDTSRLSNMRKTRIHHCPYCKHTSNRANNMKEHIRTHDPNRPKNYLCPVCDKRFARKHDMKRHAKSHERQQKRQG